MTIKRPFTGLLLIACSSGFLATAMTGCSDDPASESPNGQAGADGEPSAGGEVAEPGAGGNGGEPSSAGGASGASAAGGNGGAEVGSSTTEDVTKGSATTLALEGGGSLFIGAASLVDDLTISIDQSTPSADLPDAETILGSLYELGPSGTEFVAAQPVYLTLPVPALEDGKTAVISTKQADDTAWQDLPTIVNAGLAYAATEHFSQFVVRQIDAEDLCPSFDSECGSGDVVGTWKVAAFCNGELNSYQLPGLLADCPTTAPTAQMASGGTVTLEADLSVTQAIVVPYRSIGTAALPGSCLTNYDTCDDVATAIVATKATYLDAVCTGDVADGCDCTMIYKPSVLPVETSGVYSIAAGKLAVGNIPARTYCVAGDYLSYSWGSEAGTQFGFLMSH